MYFKQFYLGCLAHASYLIGSEGEAAVVDPQRDVDQYIDEATKQRLNIKYVIETHLHADFVSGHRELAARTGAQIIFGHKADATFPHIAAMDGDEFKVGNVILRILETPGHTPESISVLVIDSEVSDRPQKVLTGDTLFIGDVGRPDLVGSKGYTAEDMAGFLYESLHEKLMKLDDNVEVYPAHGAGSLCGRNLSTETSSTIGQQRKFNYALNPISKEEFVKMMTTDLPEVPTYFTRDTELNRIGAQSLSDLKRPTELSPEEVNKLVQQGYLILDVRSSTAFGAGHIPGSINIGLSGQFASWAGSLIAAGTPIIIIAEDPAKVDEAVTRLSRVGIESVKGYLKEEIFCWDKANLELETTAQILINELASRIEEKSDLQIVDVRRPAEYRNGHVPGAINVQLADLEEEYSQFDQKRPLAVICASGYRSSIATSLFARHGFRNIFNIVGGTTAWVNANYPIEKEVIASAS
jgi:hydroxyacylglutathione hydrolase